MIIYILLYLGVGLVVMMLLFSVAVRLNNTNPKRTLAILAFFYFFNVAALVYLNYELDLGLW